MFDNLSGWKFAACEVFICAAVATVIYSVVSPIMHWNAGRPSHNGQVRMIAQNHIELVAQKDRLIVYVTDHDGNPSDLKDFKIRATIGNGTAQPMRTTAPDKTRFELPGDFQLTRNTPVLLTIERACDPATTVAFTPLNPEAPIPKELICSPPPRQTCSQAGMQHG